MFSKFLWATHRGGRVKQVHLGSGAKVLTWEYIFLCVSGDTRDENSHPSTKENFEFLQKEIWHSEIQNFWLTLLSFYKFLF